MKTRKLSLKLREVTAACARLLRSKVCKVLPEKKTLFPSTEFLIGNKKVDEEYIKPYQFLSVF